MIGSIPPSSRIHLLGVSGTAMASLAGLLKERGIRVTGSDSDCYPPMSTLLAELGIEVLTPYASSNLPEGVDLVVVGNALSRGNPELEAVLERRIPYVSMPEILKDLFLRNRTPVVVAGTHGKTTTSSLTAWILECAGLDPGFLIGGVPLNFTRSFRTGGGAPFVVEGDEYDTAFFDKGPKFLHYLPAVAIVANVEFDHADIYRDADEVERAFRLLANLVPRNGLLVVGTESERARSIAETALCPVETFAVEGEADWTAEVLETGASGTRFVLRRRGVEIAKATALLWGPASLRNALAASASAFFVGCSGPDIARGLSTFSGVKRRLEVKGVARGVTVVDDFAHHPTAIRETLLAARRRFPGAKLFAVFEPRSFTSRSRVFQKEMGEALAFADEVILAKVFSSRRLSAAEELSEEELVSDLTAAGIESAFEPGVDEIVARLDERAKPSDVILVMSNGSFGGLHQKLLDALGG
ncbi:MAG TPA: UDP-N-acetylmuramate:L-alanyl-gamma-D-glutamyl-meso-diaminopimelate ligase [Vicinamibacteria bacterium]|nr:UDP-N-acetylmuramate:L-alanyl-gamma-D-glutamyl-meso-diaminopimelate ligase [Vicinamibacteria bacterium]